MMAVPRSGERTAGRLLPEEEDVQRVPRDAQEEDDDEDQRCRDGEDEVQPLVAQVHEVRGDQRGFHQRQGHQEQDDREAGQPQEDRRDFQPRDHQQPEPGDDVGPIPGAAPDVLVMLRHGVSSALGQIRYSRVKMNTQTRSTKCQYSPVISTLSAEARPREAWIVFPNRESRPLLTWPPWN